MKKIQEKYALLLPDRGIMAENKRDKRYMQDFLMQGCEKRICTFRVFGETEDSPKRQRKVMQELRFSNSESKAQPIRSLLKAKFPSPTRTTCKHNSETR